MKDADKCGYCNNDLSFGTKAIIEFDGTEIFIGNDVLLMIDNTSKTSLRIEINFCPMCGRKLNKPKEDKENNGIRI